jgi:hypothetical protein
MRRTALLAICALSLAGCEGAERDRAKEAAKLTVNITKAMCSSDADTRAFAMSDIARAAHEDDEGVDQQVYDDASDIAEKGCPAWAVDPDKGPVSKP